MNKSKLKIILSKLKTFEKPKLELEQYSTPGNIAADILWNGFMLGDIRGKVVADLGSGTGILGIGALLLGAKKVYFVEKDGVKLLKKNLELIKNKDCYSIINKPISEFNTKVDTIVENPPFGTKERHADKEFLEKAFALADMVYSVHKITSDSFINAIASDNGFKITNLWRYGLGLKQIQAFHTRNIHRIEVGCWRLSSY